MTTEDTPERSVLEERVARALEAARRRAGLTQEEMVQALSPYQSRPAKHQQRWHDWINRPTSVSSLALIAAAQVAKTPLEELLASADVVPPPSRSSWMEQLDGRVDRLEGEIASIMEIAGRLQEAVEVQGNLLQQLTAPKKTTSAAGVRQGNLRSAGKAAGRDTNEGEAGDTGRG